jgi:diguanylate cyclase (GGDEF)-like protein
MTPFCSTALFWNKLEGASLRKAQACLLILLSLASVAILAHSSTFILRDQWTTMLLLALLIGASGRLVFTGLSGGALSFLAGGVLMAFLIGGPHLALWALALGTLVETLVLSHYLISLIFNLSEMTVVGWLAFQVFELLGGRWGQAFSHPFPALAMAVVFMLSNAIIYAAYLHVSGKLNGLKALQAMLNAENISAYLVVMIVGVLGGFAYQHGGLLWAAVVVALACMLHITLSRYFDVLNEARSRSQQLEVVLNATEGALIMTDQHGTIKVANRQVGILFELEPAVLLGRPEAEVLQLQQVKGRGAAGGSEVAQVLELARGPARFVHWYRAPIRDPQGELQGQVDVFTDVTPLKEAEEDLRSLYDSMIRALTAAIDARDSYTHGHSARVSAYAVAIARQMGLSAKDLERIAYSGLVHDIGKLGIDDRILRKTGTLSPSERALMMQHPAIGAAVLQKANVLTDLIPGVRWHHEWVSGGGYPDGLKGEQIPLDARIIGVADALDAMTSDRPYRPALSPEEALGRIKANVGVQFDPEAVCALTELIAEGQLEIDQHRDLGTVLVERQEEGIIRPVHGKELSIFYQLSREDVSSLTLRQTLDRFLQIFYETVGSNVYLVYLIRPETRELELQSATGMQDTDQSVHKDLRLVREALAGGRPVVVSDLRSLPGYVPAASSSMAEVVIPLVSKEGVLGALVVEAALAGFFDRDDLYLLEALGERLCSAIKLARYHERLTFAASHDGLTGVHNHRYFYDRLTDEVDQAARDGRPLSVLLLDLNGMKAVNETYGHLAGDEALRQYGRLLQQRGRPGDLVARYGGDEFAVIMPGVGRSEATRLARRLMNELRSLFLHGGVSIWLPTAAWGIASFPEDGTRAAELVSVVDRLMYREKRGGSGGELIRNGTLDQ